MVGELWGFGAWRIEIGFGGSHQYFSNQLVPDRVVTVGRLSSKLCASGHDFKRRLGWMSDSSAPMIEARGLSKFYGDFAAVRDMSYSIEKGEIVAFLGPNGAGKSTTMKMLTGYLSASEGSAFIAGYDMSQNRIAGSRKLGYLPESGPLYPDMTPAEMLNFFGEARGLRDKELKESIADAVEAVELQTVYHKPIGKLSKGFRQRVGMSQALLHKPDVLIMDEPTSGLDPNQTDQIRDVILRWGQDRTILLSTHILQEVEAMATRVIIVNEGEKVADAPLSEFQTDGKTLSSEFRRLTKGLEPATEPHTDPNPS